MLLSWMWTRWVGFQKIFYTIFSRKHIIKKYVENIVARKTYKNQKILYKIPYKISCKLELVLVLRSIVEMKRSIPSITLSSKTNENLPVFARKCFKTRPSILCVIHQMSRKTRNYSVG